MFKRANKVTALLVAAASVMSIVPAMATTRLGVKDGHIKDGAIAFEDGKYLYDGYRTDEDENGIYYNDGTEEKEKLNDDLKDYVLSGRYGTKYAFATDNNGKDQYLIDLSTGKIVDDETPEDKADTVKSKLKSALKKTDRYSKTGTWDSVDLGDSAETERYNDETRILGNQFGEVWYLYAANGDKDAVQTQIGTSKLPAKFTVKLPTVNDTIQLGDALHTYTRSAVSLDNFKLSIYNAVLNDIATRYVGLFDATTVKLYDKDNKVTTDISKAVTISGQAATAGDLSKTQTGLITRFVTEYSAGTLGLSSAANVATTTSGDLRLGLIKDAVSNNQTVAVATTTTGGVEITGKNIGTATITVTDADAKVASVKVNVTTGNGATLSISGTEFAYFTTVEKTTALNNILTAITASTNTLQVSDFVTIGIPDLVTVNGSATTLSLAQAKQAIADYIATGKLGAVNASSLTADNIREILAARLKSLNKQTTDAKMVTIFAGSDQTSGTIGNAGKYFGLVNESGKYVDISATANLYVYSKVEGKTVKVKEYNKENDDYHITAGIQDIRVIGQDKDYFYTLTTVSVLEANYPVETQYFIQKISKSQGDKKDGAYLPKSVDSYQVDNKSIYDDGDSEVAYNFLVNGTEDGFDIDGIRIIDGSVYITGVKADGDNDKVKVFKIALKKGKKDLVSGVPTGRSNGKDVDVYIARKDGDTDMDLKKDTRLVDDNGYNAIAYDVDGNTWVISKGTITKFEGTNKKDIYTTDRSFTKLDVYNEKSLIAWDTDTDVYTTVGEGTKVTQGESTAVAPVIVTGWVKGTDGTWTFNDATGAKVVSKWQNIGGVWYYLKADGIMATGWYQDGATWYYLNPASGAMATGWLNDNGTWYYLAGSGAMLSNTVVDGYTLGASGAWVK